jgi:hypothetical protein
MSRQVDRLEHVDPDGRAVGIKNQCRVSKTGTPTSIDEPTVDVPGQPAAFEPVKLMMVGATRCKSPVRRQAMKSRVHATPTVSAALIVVIHVAPVWRMMPQACQVQPSVPRSCRSPNQGHIAEDRNRENLQNQRLLGL